MPRFEPFRAHRYAAADLAQVSAPPYDVLSEKQIRDLAERSPVNIVHADVPAILSAGAPDPYAEAARTWRAWLADGVIVRDAEPSLTIYRMRFRDDRGDERDLASVVGALEVVDEGAGGVLAHERTTPKASTDRLDLTRATAANLSPVWGLALARGLTDLLREPGEPMGRFDEDGVAHSVERVTDPTRIAAICALIGSDEVLIADGHHRYGVARALRDETRARTGRTDTAAELVLAYVGELVPDQVSIRAIHRLYSGADHETVRGALERSFEITDAPIPSLAMIGDLTDRGVLALIAPDGSAEWLTPRPGAFEGVRALDSVWLEHALEGVAVDVTYQHGVAEVLEAIVSGADGSPHSGVLIRPVSIAEIERTARERLLMPPKSTFFTPKVRTGLVMRSLTD